MRIRVTLDVEVDEQIYAAERDLDLAQSRGERRLLADEVGHEIREAVVTGLNWFPAGYADVTFRGAERL